MDITPPPGNQLKSKIKLSQILTSPEKKVLAAIAIAVLAIVLAGVFWFNRDQRAGPVGSDDPRAVAQDQEKVGEFLYKQKNYAAALDLAGQMVKTYPENARMWLMKGAAEFELEKYAEAKTSFEQALSLDPGNQGAVTYLADIERYANSSGTVIRYNPKDDADQSYVESKLGFALDPKIFQFQKATKFPPLAPATEKFTASYSVDAAFSGSFNALIKSLENTLKAAGARYEKDEREGLAILSVRQAEISESFRGYTLTVINQKPFDLAIYFEN